MVHNRQVMKCGTSIGGTLEPLTELAKRERFKWWRELQNFPPEYSTKRRSQDGFVLIFYPLGRTQPIYRSGPEP